MRNTKSALHWIVQILQESNIAFEIDGGLAAEMYGSTRELADIDINIHKDDFELVIPKIKEYVTYGPKQYADDHWQLYMATIKYAGQNIDIGAVEGMKYFSKTTQQWKDFPSDLSESRIMNYMGMDLPFINEIKLMLYKNELGRGVDIKDGVDMLNQLKKEWPSEK